MPYCGVTVKYISNYDTTTVIRYYVTDRTTVVVWELSTVEVGDDEYTCVLSCFLDRETNSGAFEFLALFVTAETNVAYGPLLFCSHQW